MADAGGRSSWRRIGWRDRRGAGGAGGREWVRKDGWPDGKNKEKRKRKKKKKKERRNEGKKKIKKLKDGRALWTLSSLIYIIQSDEAVLPNVFPKRFQIHQRIHSTDTATAGAAKTTAGALPKAPQVVCVGYCSRLHLS
jgi:hypothetical protein